MERGVGPAAELLLGATHRLAVSQGKAAERVVEETVARVLRQQTQFIEGVNRGIAAADRGD